MEDIARAAGIAKASLYYHVPGKEAFLQRGLERALDELFAMLEEQGATTGTADERLRYVLRRTIEIADACLPEVALLLRVRGNSEPERWARERRREFTRLVGRLVEQAIAEGDVRPDIDPLLAIRLVFGMANSLVEWYRRDGPLPVAEVAATIEKIAFEGLERRSAPSEPGQRERANDG